MIRVAEENMKKPKFSEIKTWLQEHLDEPNNLILKNDKTSRIVTVNSLSGVKEYTIPLKPLKPSDNATEKEILEFKQSLMHFREAWVDVYLGCLDYLKENVAVLFGTGKINHSEDGNTVIVGKREFAFNDEMDSIDYISMLEAVSTAYAEESKKTITPSPIAVHKITVPLDPVDSVPKKSKAEDVLSGNVKLTSLPTGTYHVTSKQMDLEKKAIVPEPDSYNGNSTIEVIAPVNQEIKMAQEKEIAPTRKRVRVDYARLKALREMKTVYAKLPDDERLAKSDCDSLRDMEIIFVPSSISNKSEPIFSDNIDLLQGVIPNVPRAAFISGKAVSLEKVPKEALKIIKLCSETVNSGVICYEVNNPALRDLIDNKEEFLSSIMAVEKLAEVLTNEGYSSLICMDLDVRHAYDAVNMEFRPSYQSQYPILTRISSRQLDEVDNSMNLIVMDPGYESDQIMVDSGIQNYISQTIKGATKTKMSSQKAA